MKYIYAVWQYCKQAERKGCLSWNDYNQRNSAHLQAHRPHNMAGFLTRIFPLMFSVKTWLNQLTNV